jgi:hypothetical protein
MCSFFVKFGSVVNRCKLKLLTTRWLGPQMRCMLRAAWRRMLESFESGCDISGHGDVDIFLGLVPFDGQTAAVGACEVHGNFVMFAKGS